MDLTIATPGWRPAPADGLSLSPEGNGDDPARAGAMRAYLDTHRDVLQAPARPEDVDPAAFDDVLIPGGHGPMQDLAVK